MTDGLAIREGLAAIARQMPQSTLQHIAQADYGDQADRHLQALGDVLKAPMGWRARLGHWFPSEVIELISHVPEQTGFAGCTALMLIDATDRGPRR